MFISLTQLLVFVTASQSCYLEEKTKNVDLVFNLIDHVIAKSGMVAVCNVRVKKEVRKLSKCKPFKGDFGDQIDKKLNKVSGDCSKILLKKSKYVLLSYKSEENGLKLQFNPVYLTKRERSLKKQKKLFKVTASEIPPLKFTEPEVDIEGAKGTKISTKVTFVVDKKYRKSEIVSCKCLKPMVIVKSSLSKCNKITVKTKSIKSGKNTVDFKITQFDPTCLSDVSTISINDEKVTLNVKQSQVQEKVCPSGFELILNPSELDGEAKPNCKKCFANKGSCCVNQSTGSFTCKCESGKQGQFCGVLVSTISLAVSCLLMLLVVVLAIGVYFLSQRNRTNRKRQRRLIQPVTPHE